MHRPVREQRLLDKISDALRRSDPQLASMLAIFGRLTAGEPMPDREQLGRLTGQPRAALHKASATMARLITWLDRVDSPQVAHERLDGEHHAA